METSAADLRAMGIAIESDEEWLARFEAQKAYRAEWGREREREAQEEAEWLAEVVTRLEDGDDEAFLDYVSAGKAPLDSCSAKSAAVLPADSTSEVTQPPEVPGDWAEEVLSGVKVGSGTLPYHAYRARRNLNDTLLDARVLLKRGLSLTWDETAPGTLMGKKSKTSLDNYSSKELEELSKKERTSRTKFPGGSPWAAELPEYRLSRLKVDGHLPRWKEVGREERQPQNLRELLFGLRVTSVAFADEEPDLSTWLHAPARPDVGLLSVELSPDQASRFLRGEKGSPATGLRRGLLRSLESFTSGLEAAALWTAHPSTVGVITLFLALRMVDNRGTADACELDAGQRYISLIEEHGIEVIDGMPNQDQLPGFYGLTPEQVAACDPSSPTPPNHWRELLDLPEHGDLREFVPGAGFLSSDQVSQRNQKTSARWERTMHAHGLPKWFSHAFVEALRDYLLREPSDASELARAIARIKKRGAPKAVKSEWSRLTCMDQPLTNMRFYRASPAQFAAVAARSGEILGSYCDSKHKKGLAEALYEQLRRS